MGRPSIEFFFNSEYESFLKLKLLSPLELYSSSSRIFIYCIEMISVCSAMVFQFFRRMSSKPTCFSLYCLFTASLFYSNELTLKKKLQFIQIRLYVLHGLIFFAKRSNRLSLLLVVLLQLGNSLQFGLIAGIHLQQLTLDFLQFLLQVDPVRPGYRLIGLDFGTQRLIE